MMTGRDGMRDTRAAGWWAIGIGAGHSVIAPLVRRAQWREIARRRPWRAIDAFPREDQLRASEAFWFGPASFGVPLALFGAMVLDAARHGRGVPAPVAVGAAVWGTAMTVMLPRAPSWGLLVSGGLLASAAR